MAEENAFGESKELETAEETPSIESILKLSDAELHDLLGHHKELEDVRKGLSEAAKLTGKAREEAENRIEDMFRPKVYTGELKYLAEDAKRRVKMDAKMALEDDSPASVV